MSKKNKQLVQLVEESCVGPEWRTRDIASALQLSEQQVRVLLRSGKIKARIRKGQWIIAHEDFKEYLRLHELTAAGIPSDLCVEIIENDKRVSQSILPEDIRESGARQSLVHTDCSLLTPTAILRLAEVRTDATNYGQQYPPFNWQGFSALEHLSRAQHHLLQLMAGDNSEDHLGHLFCRIAFAIEKEGDGTLAFFEKNHAEHRHG